MIPGPLADRLAARLIENVARLYPYQVGHALLDDRDARPPHELTPIFCGCYDWHSAVHSHWALARLRPHVTGVTQLDEVLDARLTVAAADVELAFLARRPGFELPYGLAWMLTLCAEVRATRWHAPLVGLEQLARDRLVAWARRLPAPIRSGEHAQSAFALALALDWARGAGDAEAEAAIIDAAERHHGTSSWGPEPDAHDFLSPALGAAWLIARVRSADDFAAWLDLPALAPVRAVDRADGKLVHWDGLNLSRAWMLAAIARALPAEDPRRAGLDAVAQDHLAAGLAALDDLTYAGAHWLPSFAIYALTAV